MQIMIDDLFYNTKDSSHYRDEDDDEYDSLSCSSCMSDDTDEYSDDCENQDDFEFGCGYLNAWLWVGL